MSDTANDLVLDMRGLRIEGQSDAPAGARSSRDRPHFERGEVLGLISESGAGKSTIGLARWATPDQDAGSVAGSRC